MMNACYDIAKLYILYWCTFAVALVPHFTRKLDQEASIIFPPINTTESSPTCVELQWAVLSGEDMRITAEIMAPSLNRTLSSALDFVVFCFHDGYEGLIGWRVAHSGAVGFYVILGVPRGLQQASLLVRIQGHLLEEVALHQVIFHDADSCDSVTPIFPGSLRDRNWAYIHTHFTICSYCPLWDVALHQVHVADNWVIILLSHVCFWTGIGHKYTIIWYP